MTFKEIKYSALRNFFVEVAMLFLLSGCGKGDESEKYQNIHYGHQTEVIGEVKSVIKEEIDIPDLKVKYKTIGYEIEVLASFSEELFEGDEVSVYLVYWRHSPDDGPMELSAGDVVIVSFGGWPKSEDGKKIIDNGVIRYATVDELSLFIKRSPEKIQNIIDDLVSQR